MAGAPHAHPHAPNASAVLPTPLRLDADTRYAGVGVTLAFLDSGFTPHPDLTEPRNRILEYVDVSGDDAPLTPVGEPEAWRWHGSQTSVSAAGNGRLSDGYYSGLAREASVVLVKVSQAGRIHEENIEKGLRWVIANRERLGIRVVSISLGGDQDVPYRQNAVDRAAEEAIAAGIVVVVAAGNSGLADDPRTVPPANSPSVITVGGYDDQNTLYTAPKDLYHSNYGPTADGILKPEVIAPAQWIAAPILPGSPSAVKAEALSEIAWAEDFQFKKLVERLAPPAGLPPEIVRESPKTIRVAVGRLLRREKVVACHYQHVDGTSFAAPIVASLAAQMIEANPRLTPAAVKHILIATADRLPGAAVQRQGYGLVNARRAVEEALSGPHEHGDNAYRPPRVEGEGVLFFLHDDAAASVGIAGDFNHWSPDATPMARDASGLWFATILSPGAGRFRYKLVVDGRWVEDPDNGLKEPDGYGGFNSILHVGGEDDAGRRSPVVE